MCVLSFVDSNNFCYISGLAGGMRSIECRSSLNSVIFFYSQTRGANSAKETSCQVI